MLYIDEFASDRISEHEEARSSEARRIAAFWEQDARTIPASKWALVRLASRIREAFSGTSAQNAASATQWQSRSASVPVPPDASRVSTDGLEAAPQSALKTQETAHSIPSGTPPGNGNDAEASGEAVDAPARELAHTR